jgi:rare lipoprotein A (peptidoglycan hydrolase)
LAPIIFSILTHSGPLPLQLLFFVKKCESFYSTGVSGVKLFSTLVDRTCVNTKGSLARFKFLLCYKYLLLAAIISSAISMVFSSLAFSQTSFAEINNSGSDTDVSAFVASQQVELENFRSQIALLDLKIIAAERSLNQQRLDLANANARLKEAEDRYNTTLKLFEWRLSAIYKLGEHPVYEILFSSEDFTDAIAQISYLTVISENDRKLVDQVKNEAEEVRALHELVDNLKQTRAEDLNELKRQRDQLQAQVESGKKQIDAAMLKLAQAQERDEENRRLAEEATLDDAAADYLVSGPSVLIGSSPPPGLQPSGVILRGVASWYGPGFHGNRTASGERYNMYAYTAAHKTLPLGTWLKVTYRGRSVFVRINDRGPYIGNRILDLSKASAEALGLSGIGYVTAEIYR